MRIFRENFTITNDLKVFLLKKLSTDQLDFSNMFIQSELTNTPYLSAGSDQITFIQDTGVSYIVYNEITTGIETRFEISEDLYSFVHNHNALSNIK